MEVFQTVFPQSLCTSCWLAVLCKSW